MTIMEATILHWQPSDMSSLVIGSAIWTAVVGLLWFRYKKMSKQVQKVPRNFSFTSQGIALGSFPASTNYPDNVINATVLFDECPSREDVEELVVEKMLEYERLSTIPDPSTGSCRSIPNLDRSKLVRHEVIEGDDSVTYETVRAHMHDPVSKGRGDLPWWEILIIENRGPGQSACVLRMHHALGDGLSMVYVAEHICTYTDGTPLEAIVPSNMADKFKLRMPWWKLAWKSLQAVVHVLTLQMTARDDRTVFSKSLDNNMVHTWNREFVLFHEIPLDFVKELKNKAGVKVNDVLLTCLSQAIHEYLKQQNCEVLNEKGTNLQCRALYPIGFPRPTSVTSDKAKTLRNRWVLVSGSVGLGEKDVMSRLKFISNHMTEIKESPVAAVRLSIQNAILPWLPHSLCRQVVFDTFSRHSMVVSNVPGPERPVSFAGKEVKGVQMFFSQLLPQVSLISYRGKIFGNMCVDPAAIPNCQSVSPLFSLAFVQLAEALDVPVPESVGKHAKQTL